MKKLTILTAIILLGTLRFPLQAQNTPELSKSFGTLSDFSLLPVDSQHPYGDIYFRLGWSKKSPYQVALQFTNQSYQGQKLKFALKDLTSKKMVIIDIPHKSPVAVETVGAISEGVIWTGAIDSDKDQFILRLWNDSGDEIDSPPLSTVKPQK